MVAYGTIFSAMDGKAFDCLLDPFNEGMNGSGMMQQNKVVKPVDMKSNVSEIPCQQALFIRKNNY